MVDVNFTLKSLFYLSIVGFIIWTYLMEGQHNLCMNELRNSATACKSDSYRIDPHEGDSLADLTQRLWNYTTIDQEKVFWRRSIIFSIIVTVVILYIVFYQMNSYYAMHVDFRSNIFAQHTINKLRENLGLRESTSAKDFTY